MNIQQQKVLKQIRSFIILVAILFLPHHSFGAEILKSSVTHKDGTYTVKYLVSLNANKDDVLKILLDFNNLTKLNQHIISSKVLSKNEDHQIVEVINRGCVMIFCKSIHNTQIVKLNGNVLSAITIAEKSNLKYGKLTWSLITEKDKTKIDFEAIIQPDFFIPPFIGPILIKGIIADNSIETLMNIEKTIRRNK